jgi:hypothetical protein
MPNAITDFAEYRRQRGEPQFMLCPNCEDETAMLPIVLQGTDGPFISGLLCVGPKCPQDGTFVAVVNGFPQLS